MILTKEKQVNIVISHKKKIVKLTNKMLEVFHEAEEKEELNNGQKLLVKQLINEVVSELATIAGFCGSDERKWTDRMTEIVARTSVILDLGWIPLFEFWCTMVNSIKPNYNKTPFKFFGGDFRLKWREFETKLGALADRR